MSNTFQGKTDREKLTVNIWEGIFKILVLLQSLATVGVDLSDQWNLHKIWLTVQYTSFTWD